jgi:hypothetical protein
MKVVTLLLGSTRNCGNEKGTLDSILHWSVFYAGNLTAGAMIGQLSKRVRTMPEVEIVKRSNHTGKAPYPKWIR